MDAFLRRWDRRLDDPHSDKRQLYDQIHASDHSSAVLWRLARVSLLFADAFEKRGQREDCERAVKEAVDFGSRAVQLSPESLDCNKWYCAAVGRFAAFVSVKERIRFGHVFQKHARIALDVDPNDRVMNHLYGRWCYHVSALSFFERRIAAAFIAKPPESSYSQALEALLRANSSHDWIANHLWISKALIADKRPQESAQYVKRGLELKPRTEEDELSRKELLFLREKLAFD
ncbi:unnamed protein product [Medioppia subpectinata]|uniref:Regulator of microtubule dynamics protein 1 n=1 Tax=Medioppia subpectinata TaxID=1979941 RepID=A0A7R9PWV8_9ACAR|nr:unnamed protein product [Medioppia subpectinata]CAG2104168.1 unnamed protein product [Medioppia subpectinata]